VKVTKTQLKELIRNVVKEQLEKKQHAAFSPDKRLKPDVLAKALEKLKAKKQEKEEEKKKSSEVQKKRAGMKQSMRGISVESAPNITEQARYEVPEDILRDVRRVAKNYMEGQARWLSLERIFDEVVGWVDDPMQAVEIVYEELNTAAKGGVGSDPQTTVPEVLKRKAQIAYDKLTDLAHTERLAKKYGL
jgi:hypothetical protein